MIFYTHPTYQIISDLVKRFVGSLEGKTILDSGCGNGYLLDITSPRMVKRYIGYDISEDAITEAGNKFELNKNVFFQTASRICEINLRRNYFDAIFSIGVLQYLKDEDIREFFNTSSRVLRNGGRLFISCTTDHKIYKWLNLYNLVLPSVGINRTKILRMAKECNLNCLYQREGGLIFGPIFSHNLVLFFDLLDKLLFKTKGKLGFFGKGSRIISTLLLKYEFRVPFDYGYTLYLVFSKN